MLLIWVFKILFFEKVMKGYKGAKFDKPRQYFHYLNSRNKGLLLDGQDKRLSVKESFQNVCVIARVGAGKTTRYIIPNVLDKASQNCSIVVNDPKGEVYDLTSEHMKKNGYNVVIIDPVNLSRSSRFNPLLEVKDDIEIEQIAEILVKAGNPTKDDEFWNQGAIRFVSFFLKCLRNAGYDNPGYFTLSNLYYLLQNFGQDGSDLDSFVSRYSYSPYDIHDKTLSNEWKGLMTGNSEGIQSFVLNAITALRAMSNQKVCELTASSDFSLEELRKKKTIIYFVTPPQHAEYYSFLTSVFFRSVFNMSMRKIPAKSDLPIYVLYDEFGHSTIPNFVSTANTIRGYRVSISIILQSIAQLNARYGRDYAYSIQGGFTHYLSYAGSDPETAQFFEKIIGKTRERQMMVISNPASVKYQEYNLLLSNEVRTMKDNEAILVSGNRNATILKTKGFFEIRKFSSKTKMAPQEKMKKPRSKLVYVDL